MCIRDSSTPTRESTGQYVDDTAITARVKTALGKDEVGSLLSIGVETYKGTVQLSGFVDTYEQRQHAVEIANAIAGVTKVENSLLIKTETL